jgi:hypothetical protein
MRTCGIAGGILLAAVLLSAQTLTFTSPGGSTTWEAGTTQTIAWTIRAPNPSVGRVTVRLLYRVLPNGTWTEIGQIEAFRQKYDWDIPAAVSGRVMIRAIWSLSVPLTVNSPAFQVRGTQTGLKKVPSSVSAVKTAGAAGSDYRIESAVFEDGRALSEGIMYSPDVANPMILVVRIVWNNVAGPYGIQCTNHKLAIVDARGGMILNPVTVPAPDRNGVIAMPVRVMIPRGLRVGDSYPFRVTFRPADPACDANSSNNERSFSTRLVRMGGNDLVVRIVGLNYQSPNLSVTYEINNVSGAETLRRVRVRVTIERTGATRGMIVSELPPGTWKRLTSTVRFEIPSPITRGETMVIVSVDPDNEVAELREDNNSDGERFRWNWKLPDTKEPSS